MKLLENIVIFGCGGHSRSVTDIILMENPEAKLLYVDENARDNETLYGFKVLKEWPILDQPCFVAIGDNIKRKAKLLEWSGKNLVSVVSTTARIGLQARIARGCFVGNFCHIGPEVVIGEGSIINTASVIEHEVQIGNYCHIGPNATISGRCKLGELVFVGVGASIKDHVSICSEVVIGAGVTIVKDITEAGTYVGCPAKKNN